PNDYTNEEEIEFFTYVPTVWDESHYLSGEIGRHISVARRKGNTWYIGSAAGLQKWQEELSLDFLTNGKSYTATLYEDGKDSSIVKRNFEVKKGDRLTVRLEEKGGQALIIRPAGW
ncbi:MAG: glycoside hydrolase family 97 C-terminal domain-containing protein, partial [Chitinophagaceae bacterium]|nr:glycoside hydrolase family 97 C-terminal domain-containing protein [Chitinophagaceae bacterium]